MTIFQMRRWLMCAAFCVLSPSAMVIGQLPTHYPRTLDLDSQFDRQTVVERIPGKYLGHPTTCLLDDGRTILCVYPEGHGRGPIVYRRSPDGGKSWEPRSETPSSWSTSKETPTIHRTIGPDGKRRLILWSGLYPARLAHSDDDGDTWTELEPVGDWGGIVVMGDVVPLRTGTGHTMAFFHDDGRYFRDGGTRQNPAVMTLYKTRSTDGGLTWSYPESYYRSSDIHLCEPGVIRSPDGKTLAILLRENRRRKNSHLIVSDDEGQTFSDPIELPLWLTGDRHIGRYTNDGRLFISFRCKSPTSQQDVRPYEGDWVAWVGSWDDLIGGKPGDYFVRLKDNHKAADCAYPGVEVLPDDTIVTTTYGHWTTGESPYILSVRLKLSELDAMADRDTQID